MSIELKTVNPAVFDDPEFCEDNPEIKGYKCCKSFDDAQEKCFLFGIHLEFEDDVMRFKKCQECKDHYEKNQKCCEPFQPCQKCAKKTEYLPISEMKEFVVNYWLLDASNIIGKGFLRPDNIIIYDQDFTPLEFDKPVMFAEIKPPQVPGA